MFVVLFILLANLDSLIVITSNFWFAVFRGYSRSSKVLLREYVLRWNEERERKSLIYFQFFVSSVLSYLQLITFSEFLMNEFDDKLLNWLNNKLRFGANFKLTNICTILIIVKNKWTKILIVKCTKRKYITNAFKTKPWFSTGSNMMEIKQV